MFMTLTGESSWQSLRRSVVDFYSKNEKSLFEPPFSPLRGNVRIQSMARGKVRGRLYIRRNWTFFRYLLRLRRYERKSVEVDVFRGGGSFWAQISEGRGRRPPATVGIRVAEWYCPFVWYQIKNICSASFSFVTIHACDRQTDGRTDRQNYDSQDRPRICSRGKNV